MAETVTLERFLSLEILISDKLNAIVDTLNQDVSDTATNTSNLAKVMAYLWPLDFTLTLVSPSTIQDASVGASCNVKIQWSNAKMGDDAKTIESVKVDQKAVANTGTYETTTSTSHTYSVEITTTDGLTKTKQVSVSYVYPTYFFFSTEADWNKVDIKGGKNLIGSISGTRTITNDTGALAYLWICTPHNVSSVRTTSGVIMGIAGSSRGDKNNLHYWRSNDALKATSWTLSMA